MFGRRPAYGATLSFRRIPAKVSLPFDLPTFAADSTRDESEQRQEDGADGVANGFSLSYGQSLPSGNPCDARRLNLFLRHHFHPGMDISLLARVGVLLDDLDFDDGRDDLHSAP